METVISEIPDELGIDRADEDSGAKEPGCHRLVVPARMLHAYLCLSLQTIDESDEFVDGGLGVTVIPRSQDYFVPGLSDCDCAFLLGNIDTNGVQETIPCD